MSNVENEGLRTLDQIRAQRGRWYGQIDTTARLNPGELEEVEAAARRGTWADPLKVLALVNTITALSRRVAVRFNETAQARQDAVAARERAERAERALAAREPMADLGHLADAVARAEREAREVRRLNRANRDLAQQVRDVAASAAGERELRRKALEEAEQARTSLKDARVQIAGLRAERGALYTREQVAQLQTSEAELVSAPLKRRIGEPEQSVTARDGILERVREETGRQAIELEDNLKAARLRIEELEAQGNRAVTAVNERDQALETVADLVYAEETTQALEQETAIGWSARASRLGQVVRGVRAAMPAWLDGRERSERDGREGKGRAGA